MKKQLNILDYFILFALFLFTVWVPLQCFVLHVDGASRLPNTLIYIAAVIVFFFYSGLLKKYRVPILTWAVWIVYTVINASFKSDLVGGVWSIPFFIFLLTGKWLYFIVLLAMLERYRDLVFKILLLGLACGCILYLFFGEVSIHGSGKYERLSSSSLNANEIALTGTALAVVSVYFLLKKNPSLFWAGFGGATALMIIIFTASRTAFAGAALVVVVGIWIWLRRRISTTASLILLIILLAIFALPVWRYIQTNTVVGERFVAMGDEVGQFRFQVQEGWISKLLGERSVYYYEGIDIWKRAPWCGIGYNNFILYSTFGTVCHIEYMAQLSEGGVIGFVIYSLFLLQIIIPVIKPFLKLGKNIALERIWTLSAVLVLLLVQVGLFTSMQTFFYILCALALYGALNSEFDETDKGKVEEVQSLSA